MVKKLAFALPPADLKLCDVVGVIVVDQINPPRRYAIPTTDVLAVHKIVGTAISQGNGMAAWNPSKTLEVA